MRRRLVDLAHARAGDKGDTSTICLFPYEAALYGDLVREVTAERVRSHLGSRVRGVVTRFELPNLPGLLFVCESSLSGGVTTSLELDRHGKGLGQILLAMCVNVEPFPSREETVS
jgi:hypothetical protein